MKLTPKSTLSADLQDAKRSMGRPRFALFGLAIGRRTVQDVRLHTFGNGLGLVAEVKIGGKWQPASEDLFNRIVARHIEHEASKQAPITRAAPNAPQAKPFQLARKAPPPFIAELAVSDGASSFASDVSEGLSERASLLSAASSLSGHSRSTSVAERPLLAADAAKAKPFKLARKAPPPLLADLDLGGSLSSSASGSATAPAPAARPLASPVAGAGAPQADPWQTVYDALAKPATYLDSKSWVRLQREDDDVSDSGSVRSGTSGASSSIADDEK